MTFGNVCLVFLAASGLVCILWVALGWLLPGRQCGAVVCMCYPGLKELPGLRRYAWLQELGLLSGPVLLVDRGLSDREKNILRQLGRNVEFCSLEELPARLEQERIVSDRTGIGDHSGRS